jgi:hypothetical protein
MTGIEPLIEPATKALTGIVIKTAWDGGRKVLGVFGPALNEHTQQLIFNASRQYITNYSERHGSIKVLGMQKPTPLDSIYTAVQFLDEEEICQFDSIEALEESYRKTKSRSFQSKDRKKKEGLKVAIQEQYLMVLGGPGAGKTTFLKKIGLEALKGKKGAYKHECIPVFIELKHFREQEIDLKKFIIQEFETCGFPAAKKFTENALEKGTLLILLDGLDEVPTANMTEAIRQIQDFADKYSKNRFIASCRVAAYQHNFRRFTDVAMADFDDSQIENFITNWFSHEPETGQNCWQKLNSDEHKAAKELTQTPLLLTLVCLLYQRSRQFPTNRATLYEKALRVLLEEWAGEKNLPQEPVYQGLDTRRKELLLSQIAHDAFQEDRLFLPKREITEQIEQLLKEMLPDEKLIHGAEVLKAIERQHGVLVPRAEGIYSFSHLTLQEFLTAQYIDDHRQIQYLVSQHLCDQRWREVFLLVAGIMRGGADDLLLLMEQQAQTYINTPKLQALLKWADESTAGSQGNLKPVAKRANALANANASAYAYAYAYAKVRASALANAIALVNAYKHVSFLANANAKILALALAYTKASADTKANAKIVTQSIAKAITTYTELEALKVFNNVNFNQLMARLQVLKAKVPDDAQPNAVRQQFAERLQKTCLEAFHLNSEMLDFSQEEAKALENYFYANSLMLECKEAAVRVSPQTWQAIEERMLKPSTS